MPTRSRIHGREHLLLQGSAVRKHHSTVQSLPEAGEALKSRIRFGSDGRRAFSTKRTVGKQPKPPSSHTVDDALLRLGELISVKNALRMKVSEFLQFLRGRTT